MENKKNRKIRTVGRANNSRQTRRNLKQQRRDDDESMSLLSQYEGGNKDMGALSSENDDDENNKHCCCLYPTAILIYGIILWLLGILIIANILVEFGNQYFPWYYPFVQLLFALVFFAGLILIAVWMCKDSESSRTGLKIGGWLILGSTLTIIIFNVFYILNYNKHKKQGVRVGTGEDPQDYDEEDRGTYLLGYILWGVVILTFNILFICCAINYDDTFAKENNEEEEEEMNPKEMMEKKKEKMEQMMDEMMEKMMEKEMDPPKEAEQMMDPPAPEEGQGPEVNAEGGMMERRSNMSRSSKKSSDKAAPPIYTANDYPAAQRRQAAFNDIEANNTPRGSFIRNSNYEQGETMQRVPFDQDYVPQVSKNNKRNRRKNARKNN